MPGDISFDNCFLKDDEYQRKLYDLLYFYGEKLQDVIDLATIENNGDRPEGLENEIYSAFHHIYRSLFCKESAADACKELEKALISHLMRARYDSYKIAIYSILKKSDEIIKNLGFLLIDGDFRSVLPDAVNIVNDIGKLQKEIRKIYLVAIKYERQGNNLIAEENYDKALEIIPALSDKIEEIENDKRFKVAIVSVKKKEDREKEYIKISKRQVIIAVIAAAASVIGAVFSYKFV